MHDPLDEFCPRETREHIYAVQELMREAMHNLRLRLIAHDRSKCQEPERSGFAAMAAELQLSQTEYGSDEYTAILAKYRDGAIGHHYAHNDHHPEHWGAGLDDMSLLSLLEMLCDWAAATKRMKNGGDLRKSLDINAERFGMSDQLFLILKNTAEELGLFEDK